MKVLELFGGIGACTKAFKRLEIDYEVVDYVENDKHAVKSYNAINGTNYEPQDITKWDKDIKVDFIMHGSPCFTSDTLVLTKDGYKEIKDVIVGDKVLTHKNTYEEVTKFISQGEKNIYNVKIMGCETIKTTKNHKFYVKKKKKDHRRTSETYGKNIYSEPFWLEAKFLDNSHMVGYAINQNNIIPKWEGVIYNNDNKIHNTLDMKSNDLWYLAGRYVGDGWVKRRNDRNCEFSSVIICCGKQKADDFEKKISDKFHYTKIEERTVFKYQFSNKELAHFLKDFGMGAINKKVPSKVIDLPVEILRSFIDGYQDSDGSKMNNQRKFSSISRNLIYGIGQCIAKIEHNGFSIYKTNNNPICKIEGRIVNQKNIYSLCVRNNSTQTIYEDGLLWFPVRYAYETNRFENVYDITVDNSHSFTANGMVVHNCQDFSVAGIGKGGDEGSGTRSSLMYETVRIVEKLKPKYVLWENVKNVLSKKHRHNLDLYLEKLESLGYHNYYQVLNSKDYGISQNRDRIFVLSCLEEINYQFPKKKESTITLKDILEDEVDEKYYLPVEIVKKLVLQIEKNKSGNEIGALIKQATSRGYIYCKNRGLLNYGYPDSKTRRGRVIDDGNISGTVECASNIGRLEIKEIANYCQNIEYDNNNLILCENGSQYMVRIRKLLPIELWRLMSFDDSDFYKAQNENISNSFLCKQAGNSIVVGVLEEILSELLNQ